MEELNQQLKTEYSNLSNTYRRSSQGHEREISYADLYESRKARRASYADIRVDYMHAHHLHHHSRHAHFFAGPGILRPCACSRHTLPVHATLCPGACGY